MFSTVCDECGHQFRNKEALSHDWQEPSKAFGCPSCHTFYVKENGKLADTTRAAILGGGVLTPAAMIFGHSLINDQGGLMIQSGAIIVSWAVFVFYDDLPFRKKLVRSSYQPGPSSISR